VENAPDPPFIPDPAAPEWGGGSSEKMGVAGKRIGGLAVHFAAED